jgi:serine/threonine-protein kinase
VDAVISETIGSYRVLGKLGEGGMGIVYLARDLKHDRDVAIKVLKPDIAAVIGADRFLSEIKTTAQLKHPHILPLFDSGSDGSALYFVMPFIDGEALKQRFRRAGPLPLGDALRILRQLADALAHAHARGIVHRDVKADNVLVADRDVFLSDFGIARALRAHAPGATVTGTGMLVGTPGYMAPEQIVGGSVDHRADIYAFGALAYESLTGLMPFAGSAQDVVGAQLTGSPDPIVRHRPDVPPALAAMVMRCLARDPDARWQRMDDVLSVLDHVDSVQTETGSAGASVRRRWLGAGAALAAVGAIAAVWYFAGSSRGTSPSIEIGRMTRVTTDPGLELDPAVSPDGRAIAYAAGPPGRMRIYVRQIASGRSVPMTGEGFADDEALRWPQWSPDGLQIAFQGGRQRYTPRARIPEPMIYGMLALGGTPQRLISSVPGGIAVSPSWSRDGTQIVFGGVDGLFTVPPGGQAPPTLLVPGTELHSARWSPDGTRLAYVMSGLVFTFGEEMLGNVSNSALMTAIPGTGRITRITGGEWLDTNPVWLPDGRTLLFVSTRGGGRDVYSLRLNAAGEAEGEPQRLTSGANALTISLSRDGTVLAYASYTPSANVWSVDIPAEGVASVADATQVTFGAEKIEKVVLSPDGQWLAYDSDRHGQADIWKMRLPSGTPEQVTRSPNHEFVNDWSPDGQELLYHAIRDGQRDVFIVSADGTRTETVASTPGDEQHAGWGPDGNTVIYDLSPASRALNEWQAHVVTRAERGAPWSAPRQLTKDGSSDPKWSPDGRLIAFCVNEQLRVVAPDGSGQRVLVDARNSSGLEPAYPIWSRDSQTIYYKAYDRERHSTIWSVPAAGGTPRLLVRFDDPSRRSLRREFATDGKRFYFTIARDEADIWAVELKTR